MGLLATTKHALLLPVSVLFPAELQTGQWWEDAPLHQTVGANPHCLPAPCASSLSIPPHGTTTRSHSGAGAHQWPAHLCSRNVSKLQFQIYINIGIFTRETQWWFSTLQASSFQKAVQHFQGEMPAGQNHLEYNATHTLLEIKNGSFNIYST